jgi:hypothetical protein
MFQLLEMRPLHAPDVEPDLTVPAEYGTDLLLEDDTDQETEETTAPDEFENALGLRADGRRRNQEDEADDDDFFELEDDEDEEEDEDEFFDDDFEDEEDEDEDLEDFEDEDED